MPVKRICRQCHETYETPPSQRLYYCSALCYNITKVGKGNPKWRGGSYLNGGYRYIYQPDHPSRTKLGYVLEHRLAMEKKVGRLLDRREAVHHINGDTLDNRIKNLVLCQSTGRHSIDHHVKGRNRKGQFKY